MSSKHQTMKHFMVVSIKYQGISYLSSDFEQSIISKVANIFVSIKCFVTLVIYNSLNLLKFS